ncbi:hypothetical protein F2P81_024185 [Scophthalmus maximus]|uniref:Uncharacterized protein n=1 Tax=Scophthalmus maximus TaxID=52904 RepID=A0A6A4RTM6_SCOMX|nr:hypothetical protein F2P81_024185 [Scophthalmus maximus]
MSQKSRASNNDERGDGELCAQLSCRSPLLSGAKYVLLKSDLLSEEGEEEEEEEEETTKIFRSHVTDEYNNLNVKKTGALQTNDYL